MRVDGRYHGGAPRGAGTRTCGAADGDANAHPADQAVRLLSCSRASAVGFPSRRLRPTGGGGMNCHPPRLRASTTTCFEPGDASRSVRGENLLAVARAGREGKEGVTTCPGGLLRGRQPRIDGAWSGKRDSNPRSPAWKAGALPSTQSGTMAEANGRLNSSHA